MEIVPSTKIIQFIYQKSQTTTERQLQVRAMEKNETAIHKMRTYSYISKDEEEIRKEYSTRN
jgi:hypothetical protein